MTSSERNALLFFAGVALLGGGVRLHRVSRDDSVPPAASQAALAHQIAQVDSARAERPSVRPKRTSRRPKDTAAAPPSIPLDLDTVPAESLLRLPRIGPALATRIIADRDSLGPFGSLDGFQRVKGVGPAMARALAPYVTFSGTPRPSPVGARVSTLGRESSRDSRSRRVPR